MKGPRREWEGKGGAFVVVLVKYWFHHTIGRRGAGEGCGCGSSKTHNFLRSENQILKMTGLISVLSEPGSRREGGAGGLSATICQGELETIRAEWKGRWLLLSGGALRAGAPDVAMHIKEQEAGSLIQEACRGEWACHKGGGWRRRAPRGVGGTMIWGGWRWYAGSYFDNTFVELWVTQPLILFIFSIVLRSSISAHLKAEGGERRHHVCTGGWEGSHP